MLSDNQSLFAGKGWQEQGIAAKEALSLLREDNSGIVHGLIVKQQEHFSIKMPDKRFAFLQFYNN